MVGVNDRRDGRVKIVFGRQIGCLKLEIAVDVLVFESRSSKEVESVQEEVSVVAFGKKSCASKSKPKHQILINKVSKIEKN